MQISYKRTETEGQNPKGNFFQFGAYLHQPSKSCQRNRIAPEHDDPGQLKSNRIVSLSHRLRHFHPLYKSCLFVYNGKDEPGNLFRYGWYYIRFFQFFN